MIAVSKNQVVSHSAGVCWRKHDLTHVPQTSRPLIVSGLPSKLRGNSTVGLVRVPTSILNLELEDLHSERSIQQEVVSTYQRNAWHTEVVHAKQCTLDVTHFIFKTTIEKSFVPFCISNYLRLSSWRLRIK